MSLESRPEDVDEDEGEHYLGEQMFHLGLFGPETFYLLVDSRILLQFLQSGPFTVKVGTKTTKRPTRI